MIFLPTRSLRNAIPFGLIGLLVWGLPNPLAAQQLTPEQQSEMVLNSARKAYNEKNYSFALARFREFVSKNGNHKEITSARYGLGLAILESTENALPEARELFRNVASNKDFPEASQALYYEGAVVRRQGMNEWNEAELKRNDPNNPHINNAKARFEEAIPIFTNALRDFTTRAQNSKGNGKELTLDQEWMARTRCDLAEMQLRAGRFKEAQATALPFLDDALYVRSRYRDQGRYYHGYACLLGNDLPGAEKSLSLLAPFADLAFGANARYLLARAHHLQDERAEATQLYDASIAAYTKSREQAVEALKQPERFKDDLEEKLRLEALIRKPAPDYVSRAHFYLGSLQYEAGKFAESKARFQDFVKQQPQSPLRTEAELRIGFCQVQLREFGDAVKTLTPISEKEPRLADQALFWIAKAQIGLAPDATTQAEPYQNAIRQAIDTLRRAADRTAQGQAARDPEALIRRSEIFLEIADQMHAIKQPRESANLYQRLLNERSLPDRQEELSQRLAEALHLAGDYGASDQACEQFFQKYPQSTLTSALLFVYGENSFSQASKEKNQASLEKFQASTISRFQKLIEKYPEYPRTSVARFSLGLMYYRRNELDKAIKAFQDVPAQDRSGELSLTSYLVADCILRQIPKVVPEDALAAGKMEEQLKTASELLDGYVNAEPKAPQAPDAILKFGLAQQQLAGLMVQPAEKQKTISAARTSYERLLRDYPAHPLVPQAALERAKTFALAGDMNTAYQKLQRFQSEPIYKNSTVAPMAYLQAAVYLRTMNRPQEAVQILASAREQFEGSLSKDSERSHWIGLLRYHQGMALRELNKRNEALAIFDSIVKLAPNRPEGIEASLRLGQCLKEEGQEKLDQAFKQLSSGRKEDQAAAIKNSEEGIQKIREAVTLLTGQADVLKKQEALAETRARMLYDAAWGLRVLAGKEIENAKLDIAREMQKKNAVAGAKTAPPEVPLTRIPVQPSEKRAREVYKELIDSLPDLPISIEARFELAELLAQRNEADQAIQLLNDVLDKEPSAELTDKIRLRLGVIQVAKGNLKGAMGQFDTILANPKSPLIGWANYQAGEALLQSNQLPLAIKRLEFVRDQQPWANMPGLTDRALLRLGQAYGLEKKWDQSRQNLERLVNAFSNSRWVDDARYGIAWSMQQQNNFDGAVNVYNQVTARTIAEVGAKSQLQIGMCRLEQKKYQEAANAFMVVPFTYDYPELTAAALLEGARAYSLLGQEETSRQNLQRILREFPNSPWAEEARERLAGKRTN